MKRMEHWDELYQQHHPEQLAWYQRYPKVSVELVRSTASTSMDIVDVGCGSGELLLHLHECHYKSLSGIDSAPRALEHAKQRLGNASDDILWFEGNVLDQVLPEASFDLWHDRGLFHFITDPDEQHAYIQEVLRVLKPKGYLVLGVFAQDGPEKCSGLKTKRYEPPGLHQLWRESFELLRSQHEHHHKPGGGQQSYVYCLFQRRRA